MLPELIRLLRLFNFYSKDKYFVHLPLLQIIYEILPSAYRSNLHIIQWCGPRSAIPRGIA